MVPSFVRANGSSERDNFATWYSFHRTRNKAAKAGASRAFADLGENLRVGFNTIWNRNTYPHPGRQRWRPVPRHRGDVLDQPHDLVQSPVRSDSQWRDATAGRLADGG